MIFKGRLALSPRPASRPRFTCRGRFAVAYTDKPYRTWLDAAEAALRGQLGSLPEGWDSSLPMHLTVGFNVLRPKTSKLHYPKPDIDNYEKSFLDAVTQSGGIYDDDTQVVSLQSSKRFVTDEADVGIDFEFITQDWLCRID